MFETSCWLALGLLFDQHGELLKILLLEMLQAGPRSSKRDHTRKKFFGVSQCECKQGTSDGAQASPDETKRDPKSANIVSKSVKITSSASKMCSKICQDGSGGPKRAPIWSKRQSQGAIWRPRCANVFQEGAQGDTKATQISARVQNNNY